MTSLSPASSPVTRRTVPSAHVCRLASSCAGRAVCRWVSDLWRAGHVCELSLGQFNLTVADITSETSLTCIWTFPTVTDNKTCYTTLNNPWLCIKLIWPVFHIFVHIRNDIPWKLVSYICAFVLKFFIIPFVMHLPEVGHKCGRNM